jgi:hypothetical protein
MEHVGSSREVIGPFWKSTVIAGLLAGEVYVVETLDTQKIVGCAVWFGPGHTMYGRYGARVSMPTIIAQCNVFMLSAKKSRRWS